LTRIVTFKASEELLEALDALARRSGRSRSEVIRDALVEYLGRRGLRVEPRPWRLRPDPRARVIELEV